MSIAYSRKIREFDENGSFNVGVVGVIASDKITLNNGYTVTRVYNANNGNSAYATSNYINGLGYPSTVSETMFNNVYFVREFFPYTNTQKMKNNSNVEIGKVSVKSNDGSQFGGITYGQLTNILTQRLTPNAGNSNTDYGFNTISQNYLEYQSGSTNSINLRLPLISGVADVDVVCESNGNEMIKTRGNKLNPIILTANYSQNIDDKYYILKSEDLIDTYDNKLHDYLTTLSSKNLSIQQGLVHTIEFDTIRDLERIADHLVNITEFAESRYNRKVEFHPDSEQNVKTIVKLVTEMTKDAFNAYRFKDKAASRRVMALEPRIDELEKKYRKAEIELFANGTITYNDIHYVDILSNLERIGDHTNNIAENILNNSKHDIEL